MIVGKRQLNRFEREETLSEQNRVKDIIKPKSKDDHNKSP